MIIFIYYLLCVDINKGFCFRAIWISQLFISLQIRAGQYLRVFLMYSKLLWERHSTEQVAALMYSLHWNPEFEYHQGPAEAAQNGVLEWNPKVQRWGSVGRQY